MTRMRKTSFNYEITKEVEAVKEKDLEIERKLEELKV